MKIDALESLLICITDKHEMVVSISELGEKASVVMDENDADIFIEELTRLLEHLRELKTAAKRKRS